MIRPFVLSRAACVLAVAALVPVGAVALGRVPVPALDLPPALSLPSTPRGQDAPEEAAAAPASTFPTPSPLRRVVLPSPSLRVYPPRVDLPIFTPSPPSSPTSTSTVPPSPVPTPVYTPTSSPSPDSNPLAEGELWPHEGVTWADVAPQETVDRVIQAHYDGSWGKYEANGEPPSYDVCWHDHDRDSRTEEVYLRHGLCTGGWVSSVAWDPADFDY